MVAVLKLGLMVELDENNIMPTWWVYAQMKLQFPLEVHVRASMEITWLKSHSQPDQNNHHCPSMAVPIKKVTLRRENRSRVLSTEERGRNGADGAEGVSTGKLWCLLFVTIFYVLN
jgi:hypothetical protein